MDIGSGIAIAGAWLMVGMLGIAPKVRSAGMWLGVLLAVGVTIYLK